MRARRKQFHDRVLELEHNFLQYFPGKPTAKEQSLFDRLRRSLSWLKRAAEVSEEDKSPRFVDLWIVFKSLYGTRHYGENYSTGEYQDFVLFLSLLSRLRSGSEQLVSLMQKKHVQGRVRDLLQNKYLWNEFWSGKEKDFEWETGRGLKKLEHVLRDQNLEGFYGSVFQRLKVLRNQIFHGSASADTRRNKDALRLAILLLEELLPTFIGLMIKHGQSQSWPLIPYPARGTPLHPEQ